MKAAEAEKTQEDKAMNAQAASSQSEKIKSGNDFLAPFDDETQAAPPKSLSKAQKPESYETEVAPPKTAKSIASAYEEEAAAAQETANKEVEAAKEELRNVM